MATTKSTTNRKTSPCSSSTRTTTKRPRSTRVGPPRGARKLAEKISGEKKVAPSKRSRKTEKKLALTAVHLPPLEGRSASPQAREVALLAAQAGLDKKALDVEILDVCSHIDYADLLVLMTGTSDRHVASLVQGVEEELRQKKKLKALSVEGLPVANWVLVDFGDVVVHVFREAAREGYDISRLWRDASRIPIPTRVTSATGEGIR
ncbi:MAG: ribosome silencing factor [Myxococcales bacterium]|nr:ribosome silencing factor [Polyangiaceae bacterium]MDW8250896.1 ribosome silencing factor [Myxococcales bacterium]